ncbi:MFS transporter [Shewanella surugensis]|uniref:MFS transporter n=1 Tax=Shewanella surugensis TaxID=212020 RepID=A0ABT0LIE6_9GAMM|nr:MFS transporter [Shewanella surugensis]MCL1127483.1 MFS transporter [Shewanella surugensis]
MLAIASKTIKRRNIISGAVGNTLEWYDFAVYGTMAPIIGKLFFPSDDPFTSLLAAFGVFAIGYIARPLGGVLLGHMADKIGRKPALILSVVMMGIGTTAIGFLPTHADIGSTAAILLILLRILQGLSVGGEYPSSIVFLAEHSSDKERGFNTSWPMFGSVVGFLLGSFICSLFSNILGSAEFQTWGWRLPFLFGSVIAVCAILFRRHMTEPNVFDNAKPLNTLPFIAAIRDHWREIMQIVCLSLVNAVGFYLLWVYAISYLTEQMHVSTADALDINTLSLIILLPVITYSAILSDKIGRKPLLYFVAIGSLLFSWPLWWMMHHQNFWMILAGQAGFALLFGVGYSGLSAVMVEILPTRVRCSASGIGYNLCMGIFGGTTPLVATYLLERTANDFSPAYYLMGVAVLSLIVTFFLAETAGKPLPD